MNKKVIKYRVNYIESEAGWGSSNWHVDYDTREIATKHWQDSQPKPGPVPNYYIIARGPIVEIEVEIEEKEEKSE